MPDLHTHYDNLMVSRNAPKEVIRASYLTLTKKYHPDTNPSKDSVRIMQILNNSYEVLSDPEKRRIHDNWIQETELSSTSGLSENNSQTFSSSQTAQKFQTEPAMWLKVLKWSYLSFVRRPRVGIMVVAMLVGGVNSLFKDKPAYSPRKQVSKQYPEFKYKRPLNAPNGLFWPDKSGYLRGYEVANNSGHSKLKIENAQNDNNFYVKLVNMTDSKNITVRHVLVKSRESFEFKNVSSGSYLLMYMDIDSGTVAKSQKFEVTEIRETDGIRYSNMSVTLYRVRNGNFKSEGIGLDEFLDADAITESTSPLTDSEEAKI